MFSKINFSSTYAKGVISLLKGNVWAQFIGFGGTFLIAKLYGADSLGVFSKFMSLSAVIAIFFTLRLESAFVLSDKEKNLKEIFSSIVYSIFTGGILSFLVIILLPDSFYDKVNFLKIYIVFCVIGAILKSSESTYLSYLLRLKKFKIIASSRILFTVIRYSFQIGFFFLIPETGLIYGFIIATLVLLLFYINKVGNLFSFISFSRFKITLKENINLVSYGVLSDNLNVFNLHIITIIGGVYFANSEVGWYFLSVVLLSVPGTFVNASFSKIFFLRASEIYNKEQTKLYYFVKKHTLRLSLLLFIPFLLLFFLSETIIELILGTKWAIVGTYIKFLCLLFYLRAIYNPVSHLEEVLKKNHIGLLFNLFLILGNLTAIYIGLREKSFLVTIELISYILPIGYLAMISFFLLITYRMRSIKL
ncbi:MAG: oligosaccharide flippase family protein [Flavobacteriaceae bacterium]|nr:oligosaccharide flippase family protein [Flavobacteriaceae bacterium]